MEQLGTGEIPKLSKLENLSQRELIERYTVLEGETARLVKENYELRNLKISDQQLQLILNEQLTSLRATLYGSSSERYKQPAKPANKDEPKAPPEKRIKKPSERYPNIPIREQVIAMNPVPSCGCCGSLMSDSGMTEDSEQLNVIPKKYEIILNQRVKYRCRCHGSLVTAPANPRIIPGSPYSDEMIQDVVLSKYCDLIPIDRYSKMAARGGLVDLPPHSLIEVTHSFADFIAGAYTLIKKGALASRVLCADETPHKMLEGSDKKSWFLWGFSTPEFCYLECHDTRSGNVASEILQKSKCEVLVSDVYSGYGKAVRESNQIRCEHGLSLIQCAYCNAHARRYFFKSFPQYQESKFFLDHYHEIYQLNSASKGKPPPIVLELRAQMKIRFEEMRQRALHELPSYPAQSKYGKALSYFLNNYPGLTLFLTDTEIPIDNNSQERLLRSHVVGRKTWYGTHSQRGSFTAAVLFSLVETCKLNQVNPREYLPALVKALLAGQVPFTPKDFKSN